jgi:hypothetical protein
MHVYFAEDQNDYVQKLHAQHCESFTSSVSHIINDMSVTNIIIISKSCYDMLRCSITCLNGVVKHIYVNSDIQILVISNNTIYSIIYSGVDCFNDFYNLC